jgi:hypothetical protein
MFQHWTNFEWHCEQCLNTPASVSSVLKWKREEQKHNVECLMKYKQQSKEIEGIWNQFREWKVHFFDCCFNCNYSKKGGKIDWEISSLQVEFQHRFQKLFHYIATTNWFHFDDLPPFARDQMKEQIWIVAKSFALALISIDESISFLWCGVR